MDAKEFVETALGLCVAYIIVSFLLGMFGMSSPFAFFDDPLLFGIVFIATLVLGAALAYMRFFGKKK
jgi:hypothetical protein